MKSKYSLMQIITLVIYYKSNQRIALGPVRKTLRLREEKKHSEHVAAIQKELDALHESGNGICAFDGKPIRFRPFSSNPEFRSI